jgi:hypothetical protein
MREPLILLACICSPSWATRGYNLFSEVVGRSLAPISRACANAETLIQQGFAGLISTISTISTGQGNLWQRSLLCGVFRWCSPTVAPCSLTGATTETLIQQGLLSGCSPCSPCSPTYGGVQHGL